MAKAKNVKQIYDTMEEYHNVIGRLEIPKGKLVITKNIRGNGDESITIVRYRKNTCGSGYFSESSIEFNNDNGNDYMADVKELVNILKSVISHTLPIPKNIPIKRKKGE